MKLSAILAPLIAAGVPGEVILATVKAFEDQQTDSTEKGKEKARARWRKWKDNQPTNVSKRLPTTANASNLLVRVEGSSSKKDISGKEEKKDRAPAAPSPRDELERVLDSEHAAAVIDHRQRLRKPLSSHAAKLLAAKFAAFPDANAAADKMIEAGWLKIEPHWGQDRPNSTAPPGRKMTPSEANQILTEMHNERETKRDYEDAGIVRSSGQQPGRVDSLIRGSVNRAFD